MSPAYPALIPVRVECHSGYRADEHPKCFYWDDVRIVVSEVIDRWYQGESNPLVPPSNYFKVGTTGGGRYILKHDLKQDRWFLCR